MSDIVQDNRGAMQKVRAECIAEAGLGQWLEVNAYLKVANQATGEPYDCEALDGCPQMSFRMAEGHRSFTLKNLGHDENAFTNPGGFNLYSKTFMVDEEMISAQEVWFWFQNVNPGYMYWLDEVSIAKISSPTVSPSLVPTTASPSIGPTTTRNCDQWVLNPGAEVGGTSSWTV